MLEAGQIEGAARRDGWLVDGCLQPRGVSCGFPPVADGYAGSGGVPITILKSVGMVSSEVKTMVNTIEDIDIDTLFARMDKVDKDPGRGEQCEDDIAPIGDDDTPCAGLDLVADDNPGDPAQTATPGNDADDMPDDEAQQATLDALQVVLPELREHLTRTVAWVDEALAGIGVSRDRGSPEGESVE